MLSTALTAGGGTEQFVLNVVKNAPLDKFSLSIVQTDLQDMARLDPDYVGNILGPTKVYTIRSFRRQLGSLGNASNYISLVMKQFVTYLLNIVYKRLNGSTLSIVRSSDLIYLIRNDDLPYLTVDKAKTVVLGSTHCSTLTLSPKRRGLRSFRRIFRVLKYRKIDGFHFTSGKWRKEAVIHKKYDFLLPLGTDTRLFHPSEVNRPPGRVRFLFLSRLEAGKGVRRLLEAWRLMNTKDAELHIAGTGTLTNLVKAAADGKKIFYDGIPSDQEKALLYRESDVFVFPSQEEIYGLVVLEALASGLYAVVSEDLRGNFDEFERMGMLEYTQNDPVAISDAMTRIASKPEALQSRQERVYEYIKLNHDSRNLSAELFATFERILNETDRR